MDGVELTLHWDGYTNWKAMKGSTDAWNGSQDLDSGPSSVNPSKALCLSGLLSTEWDPLPSFRSSSLSTLIMCAWQLALTGPLEWQESPVNSRFCFSETKNSFTKSESQPKCNPQRSNAGLGLGMCERHLQMTGNCSPSICEGHRDFSPSLTLYFSIGQGCLGIVVASTQPLASATS